MINYRFVVGVLFGALASGRPIVTSPWSSLIARTSNINKLLSSGNYCTFFNVQHICIITGIINTGSTTCPTCARARANKIRFASHARANAADHLLRASANRSAARARPPVRCSFSVIVLFYCVFCRRYSRVPFSYFFFVFFLPPFFFHADKIRIYPSPAAVAGVTDAAYASRTSSSAAFVCDGRSRRDIPFWFFFFCFSF